MNRDECYRILDVPRTASPEEIRSAWRELNKVWHPDRFGDDHELRRKAEEKLKQINQAYETLRKSGGSSSRWRGGSSRPQEEQAPQGWAARDTRREVRAESFEQIARWVLAGKLEGTDEVWDPRAKHWIRVADMPELQRLVRARALQKWTRFALFAGLAGFMILIRRPVGLNAAIGLTMIGFAVVMMWLYKRSLS